MTTPTVALTDGERFPLLNDLSLLKAMRQDGAAPRFNFESGDRLTQVHLEKVRAYERNIRSGRGWSGSRLPEWMEGFIDHCRAQVPFYKDRLSGLVAQPTIRRADLQAAPWLFVPADTPLDDLLVYQTSGTTGPAMDVLFDPVTQACWIPQLQSILDRYGIVLSGGAERVSIALICAQERTLTYASLSTYLDGAGVLKMNLHEADWRDPAHRAAFLEKFDPEVLTGDPFAFAALMELSADIHPKAMVSSAMKLSEGLKSRLEARFGCPVLDIYSLTECRMVAVAEGARHRAVRPDLHLEVFDPEEDMALPHGQRGELVITGGNNSFLPLIRYRTGDLCSLELDGDVPYLVGLEARAAVPLYTRGGRMVNNIEVSRGLSTLALAGFHLHQHPDRSISLTAWSTDNKPVEININKTIYSIFGNDIDLRVQVLPASEAPKGKVVNYTSDIKAATDFL